MSRWLSSTEAPTQDGRRFPVTWTDLSMLSVAVIWGVNFVVVKQTLSEISPMAFSAIRFLLASIFIVLFLKTRGENLRFGQEDAWKVVLLGLIGITAGQTFLVQGIAKSTAGNASLLVATNPIFVALFSILLRMEQISLGVGIGIFLSFVGVALIIGGSPGGITLSSATFVGNLLMLLASVSWAFYTILGGSLSRRYSPLKVTALGMLIGTPFLVLLSASELLNQQWATVSVKGWMGVCYSFLLAGVVSFVMWNVSVHKAGNTRTAIFSNLVPVVAVTVSVIFLDETVRTWQIIGAAITMTGVTMARLAPRQLVSD